MLSNLILMGLASYRISRAISQEAGPFDILENLRLHFSKKRDDFSRTITILLSCPYCQGIWWNLLLALLFQNEPRNVFLYCFSASAIQTFLHLLEEKYFGEQ